MAIEYDASSTGTNFSQDHLPFSHTCDGFTTVLFVACHPHDIIGGVPTGVTYDGESMTQVAVQNSIGLYKLENPSSTGTNTVTISYSGNTTYNMGCAVSFTGTRGNRNTTQGNDSSGTEASISHTAVSKHVGQLCIMGTNNDNSSTHTLTGDGTEAVNFNAQGGCLMAAYDLTTTSSSKTFSWDSTNASTRGLIVVDLDPIVSNIVISLSG